jgi:hypothetical protein
MADVAVPPTILILLFGAHDPGSSQLHPRHFRQSLDPSRTTASALVGFGAGENEQGITNRDSFGTL